MRSLRLLITLLIFACVRDGIAQDTGVERKKPPTISISLRAQQETVKAGAPIILEATLTNRSDHEITVGRDLIQGSYVVEVLDKSGQFATDKRAGYRHGRFDAAEFAKLSPEQAIKSGVLTRSLVSTSVKPGGTVVDTIDVSKYYDMSAPGVYKIVVERPDVGGANAVRSNPVVVTVTK